ncbi:hypothetical protein OIU77_015562 [Salix suchowensis]|uniref:Uncharacterized protein n=1 Tax=Salix suchowensis TaxID=1278906 RepID=A0ABQ8ZHD4_9ROSI|nr:hypothetical protein OIU77_015562 [Salix suchowensis]
MAAATVLCWCNSDLIIHASCSRLFVRDKALDSNQSIVKSRGSCYAYQKQKKFFVCAATKGSSKSSKSEETIPSWAKPGSDEPPPWAKGEGKENSSKQNFEVPFFVYLLASAITAIAAIGSIFEYVNQRPVFGVLNSDSIFYAPVLGFFAFTGIPLSVSAIHISFWVFKTLILEIQWILT